MKITVFDKMDECSEAEVQRLKTLVSAQRREQAMKYKHLFGRFCCLKSWEMLREQVSTPAAPRQNLCKKTIERLNFEYNGQGKPFLTDGPFFSISHCKAGIAVATDDKPVGIDIEAIRHADEELISRTMNDGERKQIHNDRDFTRFWTQKEAVVKAEGTGIMSFEQLQTVLSENDKWTVESVEKADYIYSIAYLK